MFGLPAAALAMIHVANKKQRKVAVGILSAAALTAFLTGVTEPLEFAFMFVAFPLYVIHAVLTGLSLAIAYLLDIHLGFSFSAGLIDLLLYGTAPAAKNIPLLIGMGVVFFVVYYLLFRFAITKWNMRTPGREPEGEFEAEERGEPRRGRGRRHRRDGRWIRHGDRHVAARRRSRPTARPSSSSRRSAAGRTSSTSTPASPGCAWRSPTRPRWIRRG